MPGVSPCCSWPWAAQDPSRHRPPSPRGAVSESQRLSFESQRKHVRKPPPRGSLSGCPMERTRPPAGVGTSGRGGQEQADPQRGGCASSPLQAARPLSILTDIRSVSPLPLLFTFKYLGFHCDIVLLGVCICCFITRGLRSPSPRRLLPLMPKLGQRFTGAGCMPTLAFQIIDGPLVITFNKHQVGMPSA